VVERVQVENLQWPTHSAVSYSIAASQIQRSRFDPADYPGHGIQAKWKGNFSPVAWAIW